MASVSVVLVSAGAVHACSCIVALIACCTEVLTFTTSTREANRSKQPLLVSFIAFSTDCCCWSTTATIAVAIHCTIDCYYASYFD